MSSNLNLKVPYAAESCRSYIELCNQIDKRLNQLLLIENLKLNNFLVEEFQPLLNKTKKLVDIIYRFNETNNLDEVISSTKPPIFWKDREIVKIQAKSWRLDDLKNKVYEINDIEAKIKTNAKNSLNIISDFFVNY